MQLITTSDVKRKVPVSGAHNFIKPDLTKLFEKQLPKLGMHFNVYFFLTCAISSGVVTGFDSFFSSAMMASTASITPEDEQSTHEQKQGTEHRKHKPSTHPPQGTGFLSNKSPYCKNVLFACSKPDSSCSILSFVHAVKGFLKLE